MTGIDLRETIGMALGALKANKLRAFLTLLGVSIGVFSFIGVMTGISVLQDSIESSFNVLGSNTVHIQKFPAIQTGPDEHMKYRNRRDITVEQGMYLRENARLAIHVNVQAEQHGSVVQYRNRKTDPSVGCAGCTPDIVYTTSRDMGDGRLFTEQELTYARKVAVLGMSVVDKLFPTEDPIGKTIRVDGLPLTVIGTVAKKGGLFGAAQDNFVLMPVTTFQEHYGKARWVELQAQSASQETYEAMVDEVIGLLRLVRRVPPGEENDFEFLSNQSLIDQVNEWTLLIRAGTGAVSAIALLAAGIGIMNIMLVSVSERTREIGVRKAVGATRRAILVQFLIEAVVICQLGGLIGVIMGLGGGNIIAAMLRIPPVLPIGWALLGIAVTSFIGVVFGVYPAWKASNLDPIEALRYE